MGPTKPIYMKRIRNQQWLDLVYTYPSIEWTKMPEKVSNPDGHYLRQYDTGEVVIFDVDQGEVEFALVPTKLATPAHILLATLAGSSLCNYGDLVIILGSSYKLRHRIKTCRGPVKVTRLRSGTYVFHSRNFICGAFTPGGDNRFGEALRWVQEKERANREARLRHQPRAVVAITNGTLAQIQALV